MIRPVFVAAAPCLSALCLALLVGGNVQKSDEKLLTGFEENDVKNVAAALKLEWKEGKTRDGRPCVSVYRPAAVQVAGWTLFKGVATQGDYALGLSERSEIDDRDFHFKNVAIPPDAVTAYGLTHGAGSFNTCGMFRDLFPADWSDFQLLRVDVHCDDKKQVLQVALEDEEIGPPVVRTLTVEPKKWTTLEVDLEGAAKARGLDLKRMATLTIGVVSGDGKGRRPFSTLIDNLRLAVKGASAKLPVVRDDSTLALPEYYRASSKPQPEQMPGEPADHSPLSQERPIVIPTEADGAVNPIGWVAAHDNKHMLLGFQERNSKRGSLVLVLQSRDGGQSWRGLDGGAKASPFPVGLQNHRWDNADVVGNRPDVVVFANAGCKGRSFASLRTFSYKLTFTGQGWEPRERLALVDCDSRHCLCSESVVRTQDGRLWAAYGILGRLCVTGINVRYSDDDGVSWKSWREGKSGALPGFQKPAGGAGWSYKYEEPCLVPFGKGVACLWYEYGGPLDGQLRWARLEEGTWSPIETIEPPAKASGTKAHARPPLHAVSLGGKEIFLVSAKFQGVLHYQGGKWTAEAEGVPSGSRISVAGDKAVMVIAAMAETGDPFKGPATLQCWHRSADGPWSGPQELAREESPLSTLGSGGQYTSGFVVQPYAPPNFVPVAWTCAGRKWIKLLRVPAGPATRR